jgi:archaellum biogenesis ATPase FlaH
MKTLNTLADYGPTFQTKILGALLTKKEFLQNIHDLLSEEHFPNPAHKWIVEQIIKYWNKYRTVITADMLKIQIKKEENDILRVAVIEQLKEAYRHPEETLPAAEEEFTGFCRNQKLKTALLESVDLLQIGDYDGVRNTIDIALKAGQDRNIGHEYKKEVETRYRPDHRPVIPTPWPELNNLLKGGFGPGDLGIIFGNPGGGKTWCMIALAAHAVQLGYNVIYYTLELGQEYVGKRFDAYCTGFDVDDLDNRRSEVEKTLEALPGNLIIKEYSPRMASVSTLRTHAQKCTDSGYPPHMIIIDYIDYLKSYSKKYAERKDEIDDVYVACKGLAKELKIPVLSPSQVNRAGAKDDIIEGDKAAGSYDKLMVADFCASLSRKKEDKVQGTGRFHIMKNRYGGDGLTFSANVNTKNGKIELFEYDEDAIPVPATPAKTGLLTPDERKKLFQELSKEQPKYTVLS